MRVRILILTTLLAILASGCSWVPVFYEDGSWVQLRTDDTGTLVRSTGCIRGFQNPDALCTPGPEGATWPEDTVVYGNGEWFWLTPGNDSLYSWGCIHGYKCHTDAMQNRIPCDGSIADESGTFVCLGDPVTLTNG